MTGNGEVSKVICQQVWKEKLGKGVNAYDHVRSCTCSDQRCELSNMLACTNHLQLCHISYPALTLEQSRGCHE